MSIVAYTGLPGSGKTYSVVKHQIMPALKLGRTVVTNVPLRTDALSALGLPGAVVEFPTEVIAAEPHRIREYVTAGCIFVLDEVWRLFPQGQQANKVPEEYKSLLAEHRHMVDELGNSTQIVFVVQDLANIGAFARRLVEETFVTTKLGFVGLSGSYRVDVFRGAQTGATPPVSARLRMVGPHRYDKAIFALYVSHTMAAAGTEGGADETKIDGRANILKRPAFVIGAVLCPLLIFGGVHMLRSTMSRVRGPERTPTPLASADGRGARSSAERSEPAALPTVERGAIVRPSDVRLLLEVQDGDDGSTGGVLTDGRRVMHVSGSECRSVDGRLQCLYEGRYYDAAGAVDNALTPVGKPAPVLPRLEPAVPGNASVVRAEAPRRS